VSRQKINTNEHAFELEASVEEQRVPGIGKVVRVRSSTSVETEGKAAWVRLGRLFAENSTVRLDLEKRLHSTLEDLKQTLNLGYELTVKWVPNGDDKLSGEVKGNCIYIYEETAKEALSTLKHEFLDYVISSVIEPYKQVTNRLIALINEEAYRRKERLVEKLSALFPEF